MFYGFPQVPYAVFIFWDTLFFCVSLVGWILLSCLQVLIFFSTSSSPLLNPLKELLSFIIVFFSSVLSVWYFLTFSISLLKFSFCSCNVLLTSVIFVMTLILNFLSGFYSKFLEFYNFLLFGMFWWDDFCLSIFLDSLVLVSVHLDRVVFHRKWTLSISLAHSPGFL